MSSETKDNSTRTRSSTFGSPGRINREASLFCGGRLNKDALAKPEEFQEYDSPEESLNSFHTHPSESMHELPDSSVHLMIASPLCNMQKENVQDLSFEEHTELIGRFEFLKKLFASSIQEEAPALMSQILGASRTSRCKLTSSINCLNYDF